MMEHRLKETLNTAFQPTYLGVFNESPRHRSDPGAESHFRVIVVSQAFEGHTLLSRHQKVYGALQACMPLIHALSLYTYTPSEWSEQNNHPESPPCHRSGS